MVLILLLVVRSIGLLIVRFCKLFRDARGEGIHTNMTIDAGSEIISV